MLTECKLRYISVVFLYLLIYLAPYAHATILPEDRADLMYHSFNGGGVTISGPSLLVRKKATKNLSVAAKYYVDKVSSASVDVIARASKYTEERKEKMLGIDYLNEKSILSMSYTQSDENDFHAKTVNVGITQDFFGDMTTLSMSYAYGWDDFGMLDSEEKFDAKRQHYRLGVSQILSKNLLAQANIEIITDEGDLNNPYRKVRYIDPFADCECGYSYEDEIYPRTRTSRAYAISAKYFLPYNASISEYYRYFNDTWGIESHTLDISYAHAFKENWIFDIRLRYYTQNKADFYRDIFNHAGEFDIRARDKELSTFQDKTIGIGVNYTIPVSKVSWLDKGGINLYLDHIKFEYDDFRNVNTINSVAGAEPLYSFSANVIRFFVTIWY